VLGTLVSFDPVDERLYFEAALGACPALAAPPGDPGLPPGRQQIQKDHYSSGYLLWRPIAAHLLLDANEIDTIGGSEPLQDILAHMRPSTIGEDDARYVSQLVGRQR
jgi:hypothetical protein